MSFKFEELKVWQKSIDLTLLIHELTLQFPKDEMYVLTPQIKRAADSVSLNIAEGSTGQSDLEFSKFIGYSIRSAIEVVSCLYVGQENIIKREDFDKIYSLCTEIIKMLQSLRNTLK